jgi:hypothetical protein
MRQASDKWPQKAQKTQKREKAPHFRNNQLFGFVSFVPFVATILTSFTMPECDFVGAQFIASDIQDKDGRNELRPYIQNPFCVICALTYREVGNGSRVRNFGYPFGAIHLLSRMN